MLNNVNLIKSLLAHPIWAVKRDFVPVLVASVLDDKEANSMPYGALADAFSSSLSAHTKVALVPILGTLTSDSTWGGTSYGSIQESMHRAVNDPSISDIFLLVNSPGGEVNGLPETATVIQKAAKEKSVTALVQGEAASAAFWLASQANKIFVSPSSEIGSVGVVALHTDMSKMLEDLGIKITSIFAGEYKVELWPFAPLTEEAKAHVQEEVNRIYSQFLEAIGKGRGSRAEKGRASNFGNGRMLNAEDAVAMGMADKIISVGDVFRDMAANHVNIMRAAQARDRITKLSAI